MCSLIQKYNVSGPRYTSYPTTPYWDIDTFSDKKWEASVQLSLSESNSTERISLYIHLPYCKSLCTFCGCHKRITKRHELEEPYIATVLKRWSLYVTLFSEKPVIKELHLGGGTPTFFSPENLKNLINGIFKKATKAENHEFSFEGHPNNTTKEHLQVLYDVGFRRVSYGVQNYNKKVHKAIHRIQPFENLKRVADWAREIGYTYTEQDIIFGLPHQTMNHVIETKTLLQDRLAFYSYAHVPWMKGNGQRSYKDADLPAADLKRQQYETGKALLGQLGYEEIGMDHFALKTDELFIFTQERRLHRNFMGYTASKTQLMIGLGASSISDSWYGFAQNVEGLEEYRHLVENNVIPVVKGYMLSPEDEVIRKHILNLMCSMDTSWINEQMIFSDVPIVLQRLDKMRQDGLIEINTQQLKVTQKRRPFVRNVYMAFDVRLHEKVPNTRLFSITV